MKSIRLELTDYQYEQLIPLFNEIEVMSKNNELGAIVAQVYRDGMLAIVLDGEKSLSVALAIGSAPMGLSASSIEERFSIERNL